MELLDTQVNPAVWEISGHMVLKRKKDYEEASKENAWRLLAEVSLSEERFREVSDLIFEAISCSIDDVARCSLDEPNAEPLADFAATCPNMVGRKNDCLVLQ